MKTQRLSSNWLVCKSHFQNSILGLLGLLKAFSFKSDVKDLLEYLNIISRLILRFYISIFEIKISKVFDDREPNIKNNKMIDPLSQAWQWQNGSVWAA